MRAGAVSSRLNALIAKVTTSTRPSWAIEEFAASQVVEIGANDREQPFEMFLVPGAEPVLDNLWGFRLHQRPD